MYNNRNNEAVSYAGVPLNDINWYDMIGQPFGIASYFNAIILEDTNNIVDTKGAMAVGGNFTSPRGLSLAFGNKGNLQGTGYSPDFVRFLVGGNVNMNGPLVVAGHVVAGGRFQAAKGSTYMIGKDGRETQVQELSNLYQASGSSKYWKPSDRGNHYAISSYDVPRFISAGRIGANVTQFFRDARESLTAFHDCISELQPNGTVADHFHEWILRGNDPIQNVFLIDVRPNGILDKEIRFEIPQGSSAIVIIRTGNNAHLKYGLWGDANHVNRTLYVFEDATNIYMEVPAAIWGSILAPQAMFHAHQTGGNVNGNAAFRSFAVSAGSGFEFHLYPFTGGVECAGISPQPPEEIPAPSPIPEIPLPTPSPQVKVCPVCPEQQPCPMPPPCPKQQPCPMPLPCPEQQPCPECQPCPQCPPCSEQITRIEYQPLPVPIPIPFPEQECCPECLITPGVIFGCIWGCSCCCEHDWEVYLYDVCQEKKELLYCEKICCCGCFQFEVPFDGSYLLVICPICHRRSGDCKPMLTLKNVGVSDLMIEYGTN